MARTDPNATLAYERARHRRKMQEAEAIVPPHRCEYVGGCQTSTRIAGIGANKYGRRNRFCRQHATLARDPGMKATRAAEHVALAKRPGYGVSSKSQHREMQRRGAATQKGMPVSPARQRILEKMWATTRSKPTKPSAEYMRIILMKLEGLSASELLKIERRAITGDGKAHVRSIILRLRGPRPLYTLDELDSYRRAGRTVEWICQEIGLRERQVRTAFKWIREADAAGTL